MSDTTTPTRRRTRPAHLSPGALVIPAVLLALGLFLTIGTATMTVVGDGGLFGPTAMPWAVAAICFVVAIALTVDILRPRPEYDAPAAPADEAVADEDAGDGEPAAPAEQTVNVRSVLTAVGGIVVFIAVQPWLGWILSATVLFTAVAHALGNRRHLTVVLAGLALASAIQVVFSGMLGISLPAGFVGGF